VAKQCKVLGIDDMSKVYCDRESALSRNERRNAWRLLTMDQLFFLFNHYSRATCRDHGENMYSPVPVRCPRGGGTLQAPLCPPPRPIQKEDVERTKEITKGKKASVKNKRKGHRKSVVRSAPSSRSRRRHEVGRG